MIELIQRLNARGMTFLVIEHNLKVVRAFSRRVIVLDHGAKIAEGTAADVLSDPQVVRGLSRQEACGARMSALLEVQGIGSGYGDVPVLQRRQPHRRRRTRSSPSSARTAPARPRC